MTNLKKFVKLTIYYGMSETNKQKRIDLPMLEQLRLERTDLNLRDFLKAVGIADKTYRRWLAGDTTAKLTVSQFKALYKVLKFESIDEIPDDFSEKYHLNK